MGLTAAAAKYFEGITGGRLKYEVVVTLVMVFSVVVSNFGLSAIISIATPVLSVVYPTVVTLIILSFFKRWISNLNIYRGAALVSFTVSFLTVLTTYGVPVPLVNSLPLADYGFNWVLPTAAGGLIGAFVRGRKKDLTDSGSAV